MCMCAHCVYAGTRRGQRRVSDLLELELQAVLSCMVWVLTISFRFSGGVVSALNSKPFFQLSHLVFLKQGLLLGPVANLPSPMSLFCVSQYVMKNSLTSLLKTA